MKSGKKKSDQDQDKSILQKLHLRKTAMSP